MTDEQSNEEMHEVDQGRLPGGGRSDTGVEAALKDALAFPKRKAGKDIPDRREKIDEGTHL